LNSTVAGLQLDVLVLGGTPTIRMVGAMKFRPSTLLITEIPEEADSYNCNGSLYTWNQHLIVPKRGHGRIPQVEEDTEDSEADEWDKRYDRKRNSHHVLFEKHYSVNDVKFNNSG